MGVVCVGVCFFSFFYLLFQRKSETRMGGGWRRMNNPSLRMVLVVLLVLVSSTSAQDRFFDYYPCVGFDIAADYSCQSTLTRCVDDCLNVWSELTTFPGEVCWGVVCVVVFVVNKFF